MATALEVARQIGHETLAIEVCDRLELSVRLRLHHVPPMFAGGHSAAPPCCRMCTRSSSGTSTRSMPKRATAASHVSRALLTSVIRTESKDAVTAFEQTNHFIL